MNRLKSKIKFLENKVRRDKVELNVQRWFLQQRIEQYKSRYFAAQIIGGGFVVGFLLGSRHFLSALRSLVTRSAVLLSSAHTMQRYLTFFSRVI